TYNDGGHLVKATDAQGRTLKYRYDPSGQLIEEAAGDSRTNTYGYSPGGNRAFQRTASGSTEYYYDKADRLIKAGEEAFKYDANGNLVERHGPSGITRYIYDTEDQLIKVSLPDGEEVSYGYAPTGERIWQRDAKGMTYFVTDGFNVLAELDGDLKLKAAYLHGPGIDNPLMMSQGGQTFYFHTDRMGSISRVTYQEGRIAASYEYDAFGRMASQTGSLANLFTYTAREFDKVTGLYYYRARYYDPELGRFLTTDPVPGDVDRPLEQNPYLYVMNGPTRFTDPLGLQSSGSANDNFAYWLERWVYEKVPKSDVLKYLRDIVAPKAPKFARKWTNIINSSDSGALEKNLSGTNISLSDSVKNWISNQPSGGAPIPKFQGPNGTVLLPGHTAPGPGSTVIIPPTTVSPSPNGSSGIAQSSGSKLSTKAIRKQLQNAVERGKPWQYPIPGPKGQGFVPQQNSFSQAIKKWIRSQSRGTSTAAPKTASRVNPGSFGRVAGNIFIGGLILKSTIVTLTSDTPVLTGMVEASVWAAAIKGSTIGATFGGPLGGFAGGFIGAMAANYIGQSAIQAIPAIEAILMGTAPPPPYLTLEGPAGPYASQPATGTTGGTTQALLEPPGTAQKPISVGPPPSVESGEEQEEEEEEGDPTEDDEWARGSGQRTSGSRTIGSTSGGQRIGRYSPETLEQAQQVPRKTPGGKSGSSSQGRTPAVVTSSEPSSSTTEPASDPSTAEPGSPDPSSEKEPGETEESASPPPSLTNTDWVIAYGDIFFFIMKESSSGELIGCIRQRGGAMGICDEKIGTRSGKQVTMEKASYLGGAIWKLQLSSDGKEMNGTQTTKEYGTRNVRVLKD
ncbi:MAG: RHS repeat-associated core domain-containing protein, partial [Desulfobacterales bacterium]